MESKKLKTIEGFTPGPWDVCEEGDAFPGIEAPEMDFSVVVVGFEEDYDCGIQGRNREEQLANARLIAAAPELYRIAHEQREVIRMLVEAIHYECASPGGYLLPTFKALDAAAPYLLED